MKRKTPFQHLIRDAGCDRIAADLAVSIFTVRKWSAGEACPRPEFVRDSIGPIYGLSYADVYGEIKESET